MKQASVREPAVAGRFYPENKTELKRLIDKIYQAEKSKIDLSLADRNIYGAVVPHAGYMFSAYQAIHFFEIIKNSKQKFDTFIIINPNHTGYGTEISLDENDFWKTPFGKVEIDKDFYNVLDFDYAADAHKYEHSGEVMLPLL
ncbi:MAG: AmmeMemoRadiSam system protein B, partial [Bacteroidetes bacterium]